LKGSFMKTVFSDNEMVRHVWAQQNQASGSNPKRSLSFEGERLYSYRTCIAKFITHKGRRGVIITTNKYSVTTSGKHMPRVSDIPPGIVIMHAPDVYAGTHESAHGNNVAYFQSKYAEEMLKLSRARTYAENMPAWLERTKAEAVIYHEFFGIPFSPAAFPAPSPEILAEAKARALKATAAKNKEKRERRKQQIDAANAQAAAYLSGEADTLDYNIANYVTPNLYAELQECSIRRFRERRPVAHSIKISSYYPVLRVTGEEIETSQGARFPVADALKAWPFIKRCHDEGIDHDFHLRHEVDKAPMLGHFNIDRIDKGNVRAGCHYVQWEEIERMAKELGIV
jgi:hypothetical protein